MNKSQNLFEQAKQYIPGGVNSPVRAFSGVGGEPPFITRGEGAYLFDEDGNRYIDYVGSWGPLITGHAHPHIVEKVSAALKNGLSFGAPTQIELQLAQKICALMPAIEMIRFVSSGTEAAMSAIRLARGFTQRNKVIKFAGCYHGHADSLLVAAGSGGLTFSIPSSAGVPESMAQHTLIADFNHLAQVNELFSLHGDDIAAVLVEPVAGNMNCVLPQEGFLAGLRSLCDRHGALLIFDEVITGFRVAKGGAQEYFGIRPDLTVLGKIVGGGLPVGAFGGRADVMQVLAPLGPVYQAGTLSGNPIAMTAGLANLEILSAAGFYPSLAQKTQQLTRGIKEVADRYGIPLYINSIGSMFGLFFTRATQIISLTDVKNCDIDLFKRFFHAMLAEGIYLAPSAFEVGFVSSAHREQEINKTIESVANVFSKLVQDEHSCNALLQAEQA